jgi:hypothetical protein
MGKFSLERSDNAPQVRSAVKGQTVAVSVRAFFCGVARQPFRDALMVEAGLKGARWSGLGPEAI